MMERSRSRLDVIGELQKRMAEAENASQFRPYQFTTFDDWHIIGTTLQPAFIGAWVNYNPVVDPHSRAAFWKDSAGIVRLRGIVKSGTGNIFPLPEGYWPLTTRYFATIGDGAFARVDVLSSGIVTLVVGSGTGYLTLDSVNFRAEA